MGISEEERSRGFDLFPERPANGLLEELLDELLEGAKVS